MDMEYKDNSLSSNSGGYYNAKNIYNSVGYWPEEYYRFGIVYIYSDFSLSPVFDVQGVDWVTGSVKKDDSYENLNYKQDYTDKFKLGDAEVQYNEDGYIINSDFIITSRNIYGVTRMPRVNLLNIGSKPLGVEFKFIPAPALENEIKKVIRGYFFVR